MGFNEIMGIIGVIILGIVLYFLVLIFVIRRNGRRVIRIFEYKNSFDSSTAISMEELGFKEQGVIERALRSRKNEIHALKFLTQLEIIVTRVDNKLYYDKKKMAEIRENGNFIIRFILPQVEE